MNSSIEFSSTTPPPAPEELIDDGLGIISSVERLQQAQKSLANKPPELWGTFVRAATVTLLVGETSAGKTVFLHNLAYHLATGQEFLGIRPPRPLRVLALDLESNDEIHDMNLSAIGVTLGWDFCPLPDDFFTLPPAKRGPAVLRHLAKAILSRRYDLVIVDSLMEAFPVEDENNNVEAHQQMVAFRILARHTNVGLILVHNAGLKHDEASQKATRKGLSRGASARVDRADMVLNYTLDGEKGRQLTIVKSRIGHLGEQIRVRFTGDLGFEIFDSSLTTPTAFDQLMRDSRRIVEEETREGRPEVTRKTIMEQLGIEELTSKSVALDRALKGNLEAGSLHKPRKGVYALPPAAELDPQPASSDISEAPADLNSTGAEDQASAENQVLHGSDTTLPQEHQPVEA